MGAKKSCGKIRVGKALRPDKLRRKYIRQRLSGPVDLNEIQLEEQGEISRDELWNCHDPSEWSYRLNPNLQAAGTFRYRVRLLLKELMNPPRPLISPDIAGINRIVVKAPQGNLEKRLFVHVGLIAGLADFPLVLKFHLSECLGSEKEIAKIIKFLIGKNVSEKMIENVILLAPFWVRAPRDWDGNHGGTGLARHLFALHDIPSFLEFEWTRDLEIPRLKWLSWYILLGQGGSLRRGAKLFQWKVPEKFQQFLADVPPELSPLEGCLYAEVRRFGGSEVEFRELLDVPGFVYDPTETGVSQDYLDFWQDAVRWLTANQKEPIQGPEFKMILAWAMHCHMAAVASKGRTKNFRLGGLGLRAAQRRAVNFHLQLEDPESDYHWKGHGWDWRKTINGENVWEIIEIKTSKGLLEEGKAMNHCVGAYSSRCVHGISSIFSLRNRSERKLTVEVHPMTGRLVQAAGISNRRPKAHEVKILTQWLDECVHLANPTKAIRYP